MRDPRDIGIRMENGVEYRLRREWEMKRSELSTRQKREARAFLYGSFGQKNCWICQGALDPRQLHLAYTIHHLLELGQEGCNLLPKLTLAHLFCNSRRGKPKTIQKPDKDRIPVSATELLRESVPYDQGSSEMKANNEAEPLYRVWLWEKVLEAGKAGYEFKEAINSGAEHTGVSPQATRDYLNKATSKEGPFFADKAAGVKRVWLRPGRLT